MRLWYLTPLRHAQHNRNIDRLYKLYKINHRLYKLYSNIINYILSFTTPATASHSCNKIGNIMSLFPTRAFCAIMRPIASFHYIAHTVHSKALVHLYSASLSPTPLLLTHLHLPKILRLPGTNSGRPKKTLTRHIYSRRHTVSTTRASS